MKVQKRFVALVLLICLLALLCSCGSSKLSGNWVYQEVHSGYPDQMTLTDDGTGTVDGFSCNWTEQDGTLTLSVGSVLIGSLSYEYEFNGSTLYLDGYGYDKR